MIPPVAIKALLIAAVAVALGFAWNGFIKHEQNIGYQKAVAEYNVKLLAAKEAADKREQELSAQVQEAQANGSSAKKRSRLWLLLWASLATACATPPTPSVSACPTLPSKPLARQPMPLQPYLQTANEDTLKWQEHLTAMQVMSEP